MIPILRALSAALPLSLSLLSPVQAGQLTDAAAAVEAAVAAGDFNAWQAANAQLLATAWVQPGLLFNRLLLTSTLAAGYGNYEVRPDSIYARDTPIYVYAEPEGYGFGDLGGGRMEIAFDIDLRVMDPTGAVLLEVPNFMALAYQTWGPAREFVANMTVDMAQAPAGDYRLEFTFRDRHGGQSASFTTDVTLQ